MAHETDAQAEGRFKAEADVRTLVDAEKIKGDKSRMNEVRKSAQAQKDALANIGKDK